MEAILKAIKRKKIPINPAIVISNKPDAKGLKIAQKLGVKTEVIQTNGKLLDKDLSARNLASNIEAFYHLGREKKESLRKAAIETYRNKCDFEKLNKQFVKFLMEESED